MTLLQETPTTVFPEAGEHVADRPAEERGAARDDVRLLVARPDGVRHRRFADLADELEPGDLVVVNNSATVAGQVDVVDTAGRARVLHVATPLDDGSWVVELRTAPDASRAVLDAPGGERLTAVPVTSERVTAELVAPYPRPGSSPTGEGTRLWRAVVTGPLARHLDAHGRPIAYGYLDHAYPLEAYQSVFATVPGSAEMPSAGRPFTATLITRLVARGVSVAPVTLHTGVSSQEAGEAPQPERYEVGDHTARLVNAAHDAGHRVVAVGTTVTRALESAVAASGRVEARHGWTERVVTPRQPPRVVTGLVTGWHDPQASHLLLVEAVAGAELTQRAYDEAVGEGYWWHEFGDAGVFLP
ncbi:S-adenosylmethionine:tRNA ribosyltransferase-isomerase [Nocardioides sp. GXQ0305]|uniref:S-adenosylmethionine:tRNA ribosyltransferase-isomerase n=1 Tax=Nocardioides sp. GXQ0305 TaxID=3423912 RepID=UPI003D7DF645